jgi:hypothetical protein
VIDRLGVEGVVGAGVDRLMPGVGVLLRDKPRVPNDVLRLTCVLGCAGRLTRGLIDGVGAVEGRDMTLRLPCEGSVRCGVGRLGAGRLGADRAARPRASLLLELRSALWASTAEASKKIVVTATAVATKLDFLLVENIVDLLPPAARCPACGTTPV